MNILITGATGFVGSHLSELLEKSGHNVFSLVRNAKKAKEFNTPGIHVLGSLASNKQNEWISELPEKLDAVIHTAGIVHSMNSEDFYKINSIATQRLILDLKEKYGQLKFVLISSLASCGPSKRGEPLSEVDIPNPVSDYGKSKKLAERFTKELCPENWSVSIIRPPMVIGPRDPAVLDIFKMINDSFVVTAGMDGMNNEYSFVCVYDLIQTIKSAVEKDFEGPEIFFSAHPQIITTQELYKSIQRNLGKKRLINLPIPSTLIRVVATLIGFFSKFMKIDIRLTPDKANELLASAWCCQSTKSTETLSQCYDWDLDKTIAATAKDYKERNWIN
ncbi:NAD-dependent epimerase/dehydratase family protein [Halobacteriovorax marinus]|uniref:NAD-dependent epimerase/dehydratase family protein n=1 Tax=Halobacteriovorax marinus TaxID=97084 RepID=UPI003A8E7416